METVSYQDFGAALIDEVVTPARIERAVSDVAGERVDVGPLLIGPGDAASVVAKGVLGAPRAAPAAAEPDGTRRFVVSIPVELRLSVKVAGTLHRFEASVHVRLPLAVRTAAKPLSLLIDITPPQPADMDVEVRASGVVARVLGRLGDVEGRIRREVVAFVQARLESPEGRAAVVVDIGDAVESIWKS